MSITDIDALLSSAGAPSFFRKDTPIGSTVTGHILEVTGKQNTDYVSGDPQTWDDGRPQMLIAITLQTALKDHAEDDGKRGLYLKTWGLQAQSLKDAIKACGATTAGACLRTGATFTATYTGEVPSKAGSPTKVYAYVIVPPALAALDTPAPVAAVPTQQPAPVLQAVPTPAPVAAQVAAAAPVVDAATQARQLISLGMDDTFIANATGLDATVVAFFRAA